jgi:hypothetical protein
MTKRPKEDLTWLALNTETLPAPIKAKHEAVRALFAQIKDAKADLEKDLSSMLNSVAAKLPTEAKTALKVTDKGKFPAGTVLKFAYLRGIAVATATAPKSQTQSGAINLA